MIFLFVIIYQQKSTAKPSIIFTMKFASLSNWRFFSTIMPRHSPVDFFSFESLKSRNSLCFRIARPLRHRWSGVVPIFSLRLCVTDRISLLQFVSSSVFQWEKQNKTFSLGHFCSQSENIERIDEIRIAFQHDEQQISQQCSSIVE